MWIWACTYLSSLCVGALNTKQPMKNTTHKRTQWSQRIINSCQNQLKYAYQLQQGDKTHHTKHTTTNRKVTLMLKHPSLQNKTTDVVTHQHSRKLLKMDKLMSETFWAHNKWNKIASDIKLVFHWSTLAMMHGPINISIVMSVCPSLSLCVRMKKNLFCHRTCFHYICLN
jgi:hypothetical protein